MENHWLVEVSLFSLLNFNWAFPRLLLLSFVRMNDKTGKTGSVLLSILSTSARKIASVCDQELKIRFSVLFSTSLTIFFSS